MKGRKLSTILDDLFRWASEQPAGNTTSIQIAMTTNDREGNNLVSYAEGTLYCRPERRVGGWHLLPGMFPSKTNGITQYFSDRRVANCPFSCGDAGQINISIGRPELSLLRSSYIVTVKSMKWGFEFSFEPKVDEATSILYATVQHLL